MSAVTGTVTSRSSQVFEKQLTHTESDPEPSATRRREQSAHEQGAAAEVAWLDEDDVEHFFALARDHRL